MTARRFANHFILRLANETLSNFNPLRPCGRRPESALKGSERAYFNPLRPCGRRLLGFKSQQLPAPFQSTPPVWAETFKETIGVFKVAISIHSARVGGDLTCTLGWLASRYFNPLRPCGRRPIAFQVFLMIFGFQSTPPVWAETQLMRNIEHEPLISIHSARVGGDHAVNPCKGLPQDFNPLRPCGRRQQKKPFFRLLSISITTYFTEKSKRTRCKFSHLGYLFQYSLLILVRTSLYVDV